MAHKSGESRCAVSRFINYEKSYQYPPAMYLAPPWLLILYWTVWVRKKEGGSENFKKGSKLRKLWNFYFIFVKFKTTVKCTDLGPLNIFITPISSPTFFCYYPIAKCPRAAKKGKGKISRLQWEINNFVRPKKSIFIFSVCNEKFLEHCMSACWGCRHQRELSNQLDNFYLYWWSEK